ncbi:MAG TPA: phosphoribosylaminoimidazolesuccinocarboxamide synthase [Flavobacteriaceae bacterium]|jgi:phosphoribosylaminoimidazole-succinocarboxamide synthase|nr:phosphoribosylaminoimidazolesuccinocarboxamide synthase [Flavobacteriaceae bacterium]HJO70375.1 phosphoribosylaminoimidazolesuccinocarboxamide synthase [Flavobacteriaceae bacterium]|tara:strand:- start:4248 stop:5198 length:951 start_codon:yes stop_codon:yes gene_type:complete
MTGTIYSTDFKLPGLISRYEGKVRDVYELENEILVIVASDRISAFDIIMPKGIPYKGQILNEISTSMLNNTKDIIDNWLISSPDPNVSIGRKLNPIKIEMVIRGYLSGHSDRLYKSGKRSICGVKLPYGLVSNQKFDNPIITPTSKASAGHDEDISKEEIIQKKLVSIDQYEEIESITKKLFVRGSEIAKKRGLILVDTKYEFGYDSNNKLYLIDEIHTPDSSRYFYMDSYNKCIDNGVPPKQLSKEFFRQWLIKNSFQGKENQNLPKITDEIINDVSNRYIELYNQILGIKFDKSNSTNSISQIEKNIIKELEIL